MTTYYTSHQIRGPRPSCPIVSHAAPDRSVQLTGVVTSTRPVVVREDVITIRRRSQPAQACSDRAQLPDVCVPAIRHVLRFNLLSDTMRREPGSRTICVLRERLPAAGHVLQGDAAPKVTKHHTRVPAAHTRAGHEDIRRLDVEMADGVPARLAVGLVDGVHDTTVQEREGPADVLKHMPDEVLGKSRALLNALREHVVQTAEIAVLEDEVDVEASTIPSVFDLLAVSDVQLSVLDHH